MYTMCTVQCSFYTEWIQIQTDGQQTDGTSVVSLTVNSQLTCVCRTHPTVRRTGNYLITELNWPTHISRKPRMNVKKELMLDWWTAPSKAINQTIIWSSSAFRARRIRFSADWRETSWISSIQLILFKKQLLPRSETFWGKIVKTLDSAALILTPLNTTKHISFGIRLQS